MCKNHEGDKKQYIQFSRAWYACTMHAWDDEVMFGFYGGGGTSGEMALRWYPHGVRLEVFSNAWHALASLPDVLGALAAHDDTDITPEQFCQILNECGFEDATPIDVHLMREENMSVWDENVALKKQIEELKKSHQKS